MEFHSWQKEGGTNPNGTMCTLLSSHMPAAHHPESFRSGLFRVIHTLGHLIDHDGGKALAARPTAENVFNGVGGEGGGGGEHIWPYLSNLLAPLRSIDRWESTPSCSVVDVSGSFYATAIRTPVPSPLLVLWSEGTSSLRSWRKRKEKNYSPPSAPLWSCHCSSLPFKPHKLLWQEDGRWKRDGEKVETGRRKGWWCWGGVAGCSSPG